MISKNNYSNTFHYFQWDTIDCTSNVKIEEQLSSYHLKGKSLQNNIIRQSIIKVFKHFH